MLSDSSTKQLEISLNNLFWSNQKTPETEIAARYSPLIRLDDEEPFKPLAAGYTIFRNAGPSPSFDRRLDLKNGASTIIEYAIWWDWDINHLYELEHIWVFIDNQGQVIRVEGSWHGEVKVLGKGGRVELQRHHPIVMLGRGNTPSRHRSRNSRSTRKRYPV